MQNTEMLAAPAELNDNQDSWNRERTIEQLQSFVLERLSSNSEKITLS